MTKDKYQNIYRLKNYNTKMATVWYTVLNAMSGTRERIKVEIAPGKQIIAQAPAKRYTPKIAEVHVHTTKSEEIGSKPAPSTGSAPQTGSNQTENAWETLWNLK